MEGSFEN